MAKRMRYYNILTTYLCWLTFGWLGLHHFYLRRDRHGFVWFWTCGGFLFGWLFELWRIPDYVRTANAELDRSEAVVDWIVVRVPPYRIKRVIGEVVFSFCLSYYTTSALPDQILKSFMLTAVISSLAVAVGVHTVANIGKEECRFVVCLCGAFAHFPLFFLGTLDGLFNSTVWASLLSTVSATSQGRRVRTKVPVRRHLCKRLAILSMCNIGMVSIFLMGFYFHADVKMKDGTTVKAKILFDNYFTASRWQQFKQETWRLWNVLWDEGIEMLIREFAIASDPEGEQSAYKVLGIPWNATEDEIRDKYRKLVKSYHPDKFMQSSPEAKRRAELKFISVQQSYERLNIKRSRLQRFKERAEL